MKEENLLWAVTALVLLGSSMEDAVTQTQPAVSGVERESVSLDCTYETAASSYYLYWYKQPPGESLNFLFRQYSGGTKRNEAGERFSVNLEKSKSSVSLRITALDDSGTYYCAASDTVTRTGRGAAQKPRRVCAEQWGSEDRGLGGKGRNGAITELGSDLSGHRLDPIQSFTFL
uniref:Ig-like domain-containing protein n=1 Tax=Chrysemys picta bellii TaxID=8478 RepID=A0A8C3FL80_CHRPI